LPRKTVLVIEDHPGDRDIYGRILWYNGFHVLFAEDGEAGLQLAQERHPDLVLLDLELPGIHGLEICSRLKQEDKTRDIPIVALTGRRLSEFGGNSEVLGYAHFLEKPKPPLQVLRVVEQLIGRPSSDEVEEPSAPEFFRSTPREGDAAPAAAAEPTADVKEEEIDLRAIGEHLLAHVTQVLERWEQLGKDEPWFSLPPDDRIDNLPAIVKALVGAALLSGHQNDAKITIVRAAVQHGTTRRSHGVPESSIPLEFHLLRQAFWRELTEGFPPNDDVYAAVRALDDVVPIAMNASMWGYYREEVEGQGLWESTLERLAGVAPTTHAEGGAGAGT